MPAAELAPSTWRFLADVVLVVHAAVVAFVVVGLGLVWLGNARGWRWVNQVGFRVAHALAIAIVVAESWLGIVCPLTTLEQAFRAQAGAPMLAAGEGFIEHWLGGLLFYDAPGWIFTFAYTLFAGLVVATGWRFPPRRS
jgi:Protein of Unknown function (DUF2784)